MELPFDFKAKYLCIRFEAGGWGLRAGREKVLDWDRSLLGDLECPSLDWGG